MRRLGLVAALAVLLALPATAQMRGGFSPRAGGFAPRPAGFSHSNFGHANFGFGFGGFGTFGHNARFGFGFGTRGFGNRFCGGFGCPFFRRSFFGPAFVPVPVYAYAPPPIYVAAPYAEPAPNNPYPVEYQQPVAAAPSAQASADHDEVIRLQQEVEDLKAQQTSRARVEEKPPSTVLVFKDKHLTEVQDYAIVGDALWVLTPHNAKKILLSQIDIPATQRANEERGLAFRAPTTK
jgi:hypothetical protein